MRFLLMRSSARVLSGSSRIGFRSTGTGGTRGLIGRVHGAGFGCPLPSLLSAGNGTLLVATGYGPMQRMRQNERKLTLAGVPAPNTSPKIEETSDTGPPTGDKYWRFVNYGIPYVRAYYTSETRTYDFSQYEQIYGYRRVLFIRPITGDPILGPIVPTETGLLAMERRRTVMFSAPRLSFGTGPASDWSSLYQNNQNAGSNLPAFFARFTQFVSFPPGSYQVGDMVPVRFTYLAVTGTFYSHLRDDAGTGSNLISGRYQCWMRYVDKDGLPSNPSPISEDFVISKQLAITYTNLEPVSDNRVVYRQIWRNVDGNSDVFYLDVETDDLSLTELTSTKTDQQLKLSMFQVMFDDDGFSLAYLYGEPPADKPFFVEFNSRVWACGTVQYTQGHLEVENGSEIIQGIGTSWNKSMVGWELQAGRKTYAVFAVDPTLQQLTLDRNYEGPDDNFVAYSLRPFRGNANLVQFSMAGLPESWPIEAAFGLPNDDDEVTGIIGFFSSLYVLKHRHIYHLSHGNDPLRDTEIRPYAKRGCVNSKCAVAISHHDCLMLDRQGIHRFTPRASVEFTLSEDASMPLQDVFREDGIWLRLNWDADLCYWHGIHMEELCIVRWYVALDGNRYPRHALCYDYKRNRWWVEDYPLAITCSAQSLALLGRPLLGTEDGRLMTSDLGPLDMTPPTATTRLAVASVPGPLAVITTASSGIEAGVPVAVVDGPGRGQFRIVVDVDDDEVQIDMPWSITPTSQSVLQFGAIPYHLQTGAFDCIKLEMDNPQAVSVSFQPTTSEQYAYLKVHKDGIAYRQNCIATTWGAISTDPADPDVKKIALASQLSYAISHFSMPRDTDVPSAYSTSIVVVGHSGNEPTRITSLAIRGASQQLPGD